jgi:lipopolysaccharide export system protein LptC
MSRASDRGSPPASQARAPAAVYRMLEPSRARPMPSHRQMARRRLTLALARRALPLAACLLLAAIVLWPEINRTEDRVRVQINLAAQVSPEAMRISEPRFRGLDEQGRPYNVTAATATQAGESTDVVDLEQPKADLLLGNGAWVMLESRTGRFDRGAHRLDLAGDVTLWHDNGTTMQTERATILTQEGSASGDAPVAAQGGFGTLTSEGFRLTDRGQVVIFTGRAHAVLEGAQ